MLRRPGVRAKILAAVAVPVVALLIAAGYIAYGSYTTANTAVQTRAFARTIPVQTSLTEALQAEWSTTLDTLADGTYGQESTQAAQSRTDEARAALRKAWQDVDWDVFPDAVGAAKDAALESIDRVTVARPAIADLTGSNYLARLSANNFYTEFLAAQPNLATVFADALSDRTLASYASGYAHAAVAVTDFLQETSLTTPLVTSAASGTPNAAEITSAAAAVRSTDSQLSALSTDVATLELPVAIPEMDRSLEATRSNILSDTLAVLPGVAAGWEGMADNFTRDLGTFRDAVSDAFQDRAASAASQAQITTGVTVGVVALAVLLAALTALLIARALTLPLQRLTRAATEIRDELPRIVEESAVPGQATSLVIKPIEVNSRDEIGELAQAFNDVNQQTVQVAREQAALRGSIADMFVNVARRDHALLNRQLGFLDELERAEEDPTVLANLFRLDHLSTRMRRNSESLLVLAGIESGRRLREDLPLSDVVRTASSEIEQYERVNVIINADPAMHGHAALSSAHLLSEIMENATMFSDPATPVDVTLSEDPQWVKVTVRDHGLGMSPEEIEEANRKVASRSPSDIVGAQRLGLYVVGRIADRIDAHVFFESPEDGGTSVTVLFPHSLFADDNRPIATTRSAADIIAAESEGWAAPEVPEDVDLAALTDGETQTGLARRKVRSASASDGHSVPPSVALAGQSDEDSIVLPALETPEKGSFDAVTAGGDAWQPVAQLDAPLVAHERSEAASTGALPVRRSRTLALPTPVEEPAVASAKPIDPTRSSAFFSRFRSRDALEEASADGQAPSEPPTAGADDAQGFVVPPLEVPQLEADEEAYGAQWAADEPVWTPAFEQSSEPLLEPEVAPELAVAPEPEVSPEPEAPSAPEDLAAFAPPVEPPATVAAPRAFPRHARPEALETYGKDLPAPDEIEPAPVTGQHLRFVDEVIERSERKASHRGPQSDAPEVDSGAAVVAESPVDELPPADAEQQPGFESVPAFPAPQWEPQWEPQPAENFAADEASVPPAPAIEEASEFPAPSFDAPTAPAFAPAEAAAEVPQPIALPNFDDVIADASPAVKEKRPGFFGRLFGRKPQQPAVEPEAAGTSAFPVAAAGLESVPSGAGAVTSGIGSTPVPTTDDAPSVDRTAAWQPSFPAAPAWTQDAAPAAPAADEPEDITVIAPAQVAGSGAEDSAGWTPPEALRSWTPDPTFEAPGGAADAEGSEARTIAPELAEALASRAGIQEQAFAELSQLSYRPAAVAQSTGGLARRQRTAVAAPADDPTHQVITHDASQVRSRLSAFQSGLARGRRDASAGHAEGTSTSEDASPLQ